MHAHDHSRVSYHHWGVLSIPIASFISNKWIISSFYIRNISFSSIYIPPIALLSFIFRPLKGGEDFLTILSRFNFLFVEAEKRRPVSILGDCTCYLYRDRVFSAGILEQSMGARNRVAYKPTSLCSLARRASTTIPFLAPIDCSKIPARGWMFLCYPLPLWWNVPIVSYNTFSCHSQLNVPLLSWAPVLCWHAPSLFTASIDSLHGQPPCEYWPKFAASFFQGYYDITYLV